MGKLKEWVNQDWVRIGTDGSIKGKCGTSENKKNPDRCLPRAKAQSLSKSERAKTAKKKKKRKQLELEEKLLLLTQRKQKYLLRMAERLERLQEVVVK